MPTINFDAHDLLDGTPLLQVLHDLPMTCADVGARSGFTPDLNAIAGGVDAIGFEPDIEECERLNQSVAKTAFPWRSLRYIPVALGDSESERSLNLYRQRGCSSLLEADRELASLYSRGDYYIKVGDIAVQTKTLAAAAARYELKNLNFLKLDIQGLELEVLRGASELLAGPLLALRLEVSFVPIYRGQPLWSDIDRYLRPFGFVPMHFVELHHWRRSTRTKHPKLDQGPLPYSRGQMIHGDVVYLRHPESMPDNNVAAVEHLVRSAMLAIALEQIDHAAAIFLRPGVNHYLQDRYDMNGAHVLAEVSSRLASIKAQGIPDEVDRPRGVPSSAERSADQRTGLRGILRRLLGVG